MACLLIENSDCFCFFDYCFDSADKTESEKNAKKRNKKSLRAKSQTHIQFRLFLSHSVSLTHTNMNNRFKRSERYDRKKMGGLDSMAFFSFKFYGNFLLKLNNRSYSINCLWIFWKISNCVERVHISFTLTTVQIGALPGTYLSFHSIIIIACRPVNLTASRMEISKFNQNTHSNTK